MQLAASVVFIVSTLVVTMQMHFVTKKDLGFKKDNIIYLSGLNPFIENSVQEALKNELRSIPLVENFTDATFTPQHNVDPFTLTTDVEWIGKFEDEKPAFNFITTDSKFAKTFKINIVEGEWLDDNTENTIVINEEAVRVMRLSQPIGTVIRMSLGSAEEYKIVGVVKDFHTLSFRTHIYPTIFMTSPYPSNNFYVRAVPGQEQKLVKRLKAIFPKIATSLIDVNPLPLSELYEHLNSSEKAGLKAISVLTIVCLLISLFGCYSTASAKTQIRRKEIAVRKVIGANIKDIVLLFFYEYVMRVLQASLLALPVVYFTMNRWLEGYAYHMNIQWWLFLIVTTSILVMVLLSVTQQVLKAANSNPAQVIKSN